MSADVEVDTGLPVEIMVIKKPVSDPSEGQN
jgi:hypothetical protein